MRNWFKAFRVFLHLPTPLTTVKWTEAEANSWNALLKTQIGRKLLNEILMQEMRVNANAVMRPDKHEYACGFAAGFRAATGYMLALSKISAHGAPQDTVTDELSPKGEAELLETLAP